MLFLVPDSDQPPAKDSATASGDGAQGGFTVSEEQQANLKVELDLDDAPFLSEPEEEEPAEAEEDFEAEEEEDLSLNEEEEAPKGLFANKKKLIILAAALLLIIGGAVGAFFFFFGGEGAQPEPEAAEKKRVVVVTTPPEIETTALQTVMLKPFIVPSKGSEGEVRLLHCTLNIPFDDPVQGQEMNVRMLEIRNAIYYYLVNKPLSHLSSEEEAALLKQDLVNVVNELLTVKKITDIYIQEYVVTAPWAFTHRFP